MVEEKPISFGIIGRVIKLPGKRIREWYKNLSNFNTEDKHIKLHINDTKDQSIRDKITNEPKTVFVPILKKENIGEEMCIDDKNIGGEGYTILSNRKTGKIAALISSTKSGIVGRVLQKIDKKTRNKVQTMTRDLAEGYSKVSRVCFQKADEVADKFHVVKLGQEAIQALRIKYRQELLTTLRKEKKEKEEGKTIKKSVNEINDNGESTKELLARSRYLLFKFQGEWTESQEQRADVLFKKYPKLKKVYSAIVAFRNFYKSKPKDLNEAKENLDGWYVKYGGENQKVKKNEEEIEELANFVATVKRHEKEILNYFKSNATNAYAESLNSQIQAFVKTNSGVRDLDFFHFRLEKYFA